MPEKGFQGAPFGNQSARFTVSGVHPKNLLPGTFLTHENTSSISNEIGPGKYDPEYGGFSAKAVSRRASGPGWRRQYEVSHMMAIPCLLNKEEWEQKKLLVQKLGPGTYDPKDVQEKKDVSKRGILEMKEPRFKDNYTFCTPGPGAYGIPHEALEAKMHQRFGTKGMLDCGTCGDRNLPTVGSHLGPGTYDFEDGINQMLKKHVSQRGPYDVFTADRGKPIQTGHYATLRCNNLGPGQYEYKSSLDEMQSRHRRRHGLFSEQVKYPRRPHDRIVACTLALCPRDRTEPGPGQYDPKNPNSRSLTQGKNLPGFLASSQRADKLATKFFTGNFNAVGPGRYDVQKLEEAQDVNGHRSDFLSKTDRPSGGRLKFMEEMIKEKNVPLQKRLALISQAEPRPCGAASSTNAMKCIMSGEAGRRAMTVA